MLTESWDVLNLSFESMDALESKFKPTFTKLQQLKAAGSIRDFYMNRYITQSEIRLKVGIVKCCDLAELESVFGMKVEIKSSDEWDEIEEIKALATAFNGISSERLGDVAKLAYFLHHFVNTTASKDMEKPFCDGLRLKRIDRKRYHDVFEYLRESIEWLSIYFSQWIRSSATYTASKPDP